MIVLIDNYDSFSYNLYQMVGNLDPDVRVVRNDALDVRQLAALGPGRIIMSPGPGHPGEAGICVDAVSFFAGRVPLLGVCLGHQAICQAFGATVGHAHALMHGKQSTTTLDSSCPLFAGLPEQVTVARYHSLAVDEATVPTCLRVVARAEDGEVMAVRHVDYPVFGLQFHPESIMTSDGAAMLANFLAVEAR